MFWAVSLYLSYCPAIGSFFHLVRVETRSRADYNLFDDTFVSKIDVKFNENGIQDVIVYSLHKCGIFFSPSKLCVIYVHSARIFPWNKSMTFQLLSLAWFRTISSQNSPSERASQQRCWDDPWGTPLHSQAWMMQWSVETPAHTR